MADKEDIESKQQSDSIVDLARGVFGKDILSRVFVGTCLFLFANSLFGNPVGGVIKDWFGLKQAESEQTYQLQLKTFELIEGKVMTKLEDMQLAITALKEENSGIKGDIKTLTSEVAGLKKKVSEIEEENAIVHAVWRKNNQ